MVPSRSTLDELKLNNTISHLSPNVTRRSLDVVSIVPMLNMGRIEGAKLSYDHGAQDVILSETCSRSLILAGDVFSSFYYEDVILLAAQFWLMVISVVAVIYRSIPQILAINCARVLMTVWEIYATWRITSYGHTFSLLYVAQGTPCQFNFFSDFWTRRMALTIPNLILNITAFGFESLIGRHLIKVGALVIIAIMFNNTATCQTFTLYTFQRAAPSASVLRIYRLDIFYLLSMMGLWITWLDEGVGKIATYETLYKALFFTTIITVLPWLAMGWYAVRREMRKTFAVWLIMGSVYLICWTLMFYSYSFRWTFLYWKFFACLTCTSYIVLIATGIAGVICRLNFGKGLAHYLHVEEVLAKSGFAAGIFENDMEQLQSPQKSAAIETARTTDARPHGEGGESDVAMGPIIVIQGNSVV
ncbi:hypothetical protein WOLCODRAFT_144305 [Wolfiporia cocos MD-104 SS10]|uniref:Transmembrane protein n=1 Tax=Wolfiporia cocos (strain MD-104) TaxID=742152 RepID=A0A2H3K3I5_WOLCO|nr:hypothetical protein WOLCODRAFT_144305 [Wolfiporia cocos MD-104 SS10]